MPAQWCPLPVGVSLLAVAQALVGAGCLQPDPSHCAHWDPERRCAAETVCSRCTAENHGCVAPPVTLACVVAQEVTSSGPPGDDVTSAGRTSGASSGSTEGGTTGGEPKDDTAAGEDETTADGAPDETGRVTSEGETPGSTTSDERSEESTVGEPPCGDGVVQAWEVCDDGTNDGSYGGCLPGCMQRAPFCGDRYIDSEYAETCDGEVGCNEHCRFSGDVLADVSLTGAPRTVAAHRDGRIVLAGFSGAQYDSTGDARAMVRVLESSLDDDGFTERALVLYASAPRTGSTVTDGAVVRAALPLTSGETLLVGQRRDVDNNFDWVASVDRGGEITWETYGMFTEHGSARLVGVAPISSETVAILGRRVVAGSNEAFIAAQRVGASRTVWTQQVIPDGIPYPETIGGLRSDGGFYGVGSFYYGGLAETSFYRFDASAVIQVSQLFHPMGEDASVFLFAVASFEDDAVVAGAAATSSGAGILYPWLARVSPEGEVVWDYHDFDYPFSSSQMESGFRALSIDAMGTIVAVGGSPDPGGARSPLIVKVNAGGERIWRTELPPLPDQPPCFLTASAVATDQDGNVLVGTEADAACLIENDVLTTRGRLTKLAR